MASHGTVSLAEIWAMLDECAPGHYKKAREHKWLIRYKDKAFPGLPVGEHGARKPATVEIQAGIVKKMVRVLGIEDCAKAKIERIR